MVELAKHEIPNFDELFFERSKVLDEAADKSSLEAWAEREVLSREDVDEMEPMRGTSSINGLDPEGGEEPEKNKYI